MIHEELRTLLNLSRSYITQEFLREEMVVSDTSTIDFFRKTHASKPKPLPTTSVNTPYTKIAPIKKTEPLQETLQEPVQKIAHPAEKIALAQTTKSSPALTSPSSSEIKQYELQVLCRPKGATKQSHLEDIAEKLGEKNRVTPTITAQMPWKKLYPQCAIIPFFSKESVKESANEIGPMAFIKKMAEACQNRLQLHTLFVSPDLFGAGDCIAYATSGTLQTIIVTYEPSMASKAFDWMANFTECTTKHSPPFTCNHSLYTIPIYQLPLQNEPTHQEKSILWKALQEILLPKSY